MSESLVNSFVLQGLPQDFESFVTMESVNPWPMNLRHRSQVFSDTRTEKMKQASTGSGNA